MSRANNTKGSERIEKVELDTLVDEAIAKYYGDPDRETAIGSASDFTDAELEAYGTGIGGDTGETPEPPASTRAVIEANQDRSSDHDLEAYGTGVDAAESSELPAETRAALQEAAERPTDPEAYGTGVAGDASGGEYRRRDEQAEIWARAIEKAEDRNSDDE